MKYSLSKERKSQIDRYCRITSAIEKNFVPLKLVDINYDEKKGWLKTFEKVDTKLFDESRYENLTELLDTVDTTKITHCEHNVTGKRYKINQRHRMWQHDWELELEQNLKEQA